MAHDLDPLAEEERDMYREYSSKKTPRESAKEWIASMRRDLEEQK